MRSIFLLLLLAGCAHPDPIYKPVPVDMPIEVTCKLQVIPKPEDPFDQLRSTDDIGRKVDVLLASRELHLGYEVRLEGASKACQ